MRPYPGISPQTEEDAVRRQKWTKLDWFLRDLEKGMQRIQKGQVPDGSGTPILDPSLSDIYLVLKGRIGNQDAHGGTAAGGTLTLSSTNHPTKGKVFLGDAQQSAYDEVNERIGIQTPSPAARLHIKHVTGGGTQTLAPTTDYWQGGWGCNIADFSNACKTNDGDTSLVQSSDTSPNVGVTIGFDPPGAGSASTGWTFNIMVRKTGSGAHIGIDLQIGATNFTAGIGWTGAGGTGGTFNTGGGGPVAVSWLGANGGTQTVAGQTYELHTYSISSSAMTSILNTLVVNPTYKLYALLVTRTNRGDSGTTGQPLNVTQMYFSGPGTLDTTDLQKWENPATSNTMNYAADGAGATTLQLSGTPKFRITNGLEVATGSPASGMVGVSYDADGSFQWASASSLATKIQHRFVANGFYRTDTDVDGAWIASASATLNRVTLYRRQGGSAGSTTVDLFKNGTTVLSSAPSIAFNAGASATANGTISVTGIVPGDRFTNKVTADSGRPQDWTLLIEAY